jgi:hypothetical protein
MMADMFGQAANTPVGCSKRLSSKAVVSEEARRRTLRYVEPLSEARTMYGNRRILARRSWAGEKNDFFSILVENGKRKGY